MRDLVIQALRQPEQSLGFSMGEWELLVRQARHAGLLARIGALLSARGLLADVPPAPRRHLEGMMTLSEAQGREIRREVAYLCEALRPACIPMVLLKGAAYVMAGLPASAGRLQSDTDILVPRSALEATESNLLMRGWTTTHTDPYDQRYYRQWMHELPPMEHVRRGTVVDVHHNIVPLTARNAPDASDLMAHTQSLAGQEGVRVLAPADMALHSMVHLFLNEQMTQGLRDLSDIDLLLRHFAASPDFWTALLERSLSLNLARPLYYGLRYAHCVLGTPVPDRVLDSARRGAPTWPLRLAMDALWRRALRSPHASSTPRFTTLALGILYVRAHALRMPPFLLARHLATKAWMRARAARARVQGPR